MAIRHDFAVKKLLSHPGPAHMEMHVETGKVSPKKKAPSKKKSPKKKK